jgi:DNA-3-methyladenine glycosylase
MSGPQAEQLAAGAALGPNFFDRPPRPVARDLIGCELLFDGVGGTIVETEAYEADDPACHAFIGRTARTDVLFGPPGRAYVYLCYGIHRMLNVVTDQDGTAAAVLIRALEPRVGIETMALRRGDRPLRDLCSGPGKICEALGIGLDLTRASFTDPPFAVHARPAGEPDPEIVAGPRIGITKGAELPWRYCAAGSGYLSKPAG